MKKVILYTLAALGVFGCRKTTVEVYPRLLVTGYVADSTVAKGASENYQKYSRVIFSALAPDTNGVFQVPPADSASLQLLKSKLNSSQLLFVSLGGASGSANMAKMAHDPVKRATYINAVVNFCSDWGIQGIDLDWEMVGTPPAAPTFPNATDYVALSQQISVALHNKNLYFTEAIGIYYSQFVNAAVPDNSYFNLANLTYNYADQINVLSYGAYAIDGFYNQSTSDQMKIWLGILNSYGVPASKVLFGVPFSGYHNALGTTSDSTFASMSYASIVAKSQPTPAINTYMNYGYNGIQLMQTKMAFLRSNEYCGILASDISQDTTVNSTYSLTWAIIHANNP